MGSSERKKQRNYSIGPADTLSMGQVGAKEPKNYRQGGNTAGGSGHSGEEEKEEHINGEGEIGYESFLRPM